MAVVPVHIVRPSSARCVVLDGFAPVPRGATQASPQPAAWPAKDPGDVLDYELDVSQALTGDTNDTVASLGVTIAPSGDPADLMLNSAGLDGTSVVLWLSGGRAGFTYGVTLTVGTTSGRTIVRTVLLPVLPLSQPGVLPDALLVDPENPLVDQSGNPLSLS